MRGWEPKVSSRRALVPKGIRAQSSSFTGRKRGQQTCSPAPSSQPLSPRPRLPPRNSAEVTVPRANTEELPAHPALGVGQPRGERGRGAGGRRCTRRPRPFPGLAPGAAKKFPAKVRGTRSRSQPPSTTASSPRRAARAGSPRRRDPRSRRPQPAPGCRASPTTEPGEEQQREEQQQ